MQNKSKHKIFYRFSFLLVIFCFFSLAPFPCFSAENSDLNSESDSPRISAYRPQSTQEFARPRLPGLNDEGLALRRSGAFKHPKGEQPLDFFFQQLDSENKLPSFIFGGQNPFTQENEYFYSPQVIVFSAQKPAKENPPTLEETVSAIGLAALFTFITNFFQIDQVTNGFNQLVSKARNPRFIPRNGPAQGCNKCEIKLKDSACSGNVLKGTLPIPQSLKFRLSRRFTQSENPPPIGLTLDNYEPLVQAVASGYVNPEEIIFGMNYPAFHFINSLFPTILFFTIGSFFTFAYSTGLGSFFSTQSLLGLCVLFSSLLVQYIATMFPFSANLSLSLILLFFSQLFSALTLFFFKSSLDDIFYRLVNLRTFSIYRFSKPIGPYCNFFS